MARLQSKELKEAEENALQVKTDIERLFENVSQDLNDTKRSYKESQAQISDLVSANSNVTSRCADLEDTIARQRSY